MRYVRSRDLSRARASEDLLDAGTVQRAERLLQPIVRAALDRVPGAGAAAMTENNDNEIYRIYAQFNIGYCRSPDGPYRTSCGYYERERGGISYCCRKMRQALLGGFIRLGPRFGNPQANDTVNIFRAICREGFTTIEPTPIDFCPFCTAKIIVSTATLPGHPVG